MANSPKAGDPEARRIAEELVKMHHDGAISGPDDPEAHFYATLIHVFVATYQGHPGTRSGEDPNPG